MFFNCFAVKTSEHQLRNTYTRPDSGGSPLSSKGDFMPITARVPVMRKQVEAYQDSSDSWKIDHDIAMLCLDVQAAIEIGLAIFTQIVRLDEDYWELFYDDRIPEIPEVETAIPELVAQWYSVSLQLEKVVVHLESAGYQVAGAEPFRVAIHKAKSILTPDSEFFDGEKLWAKRDQAIVENKEGRTSDLNDLVNRG